MTGSGGVTSYVCCNAVCVNPQASDVNNCGACGMACPVGNNCCAGVCENVQISISNCGSCGGICNINRAVPKCQMGKCLIDTCTGNYLDCNGQVGDGCEADIIDDKNNCGACGVKCPVLCLNKKCFPE